MYRELSLSLARAFHHIHFVPLLHFEIRFPFSFLSLTSSAGSDGSSLEGAHFNSRAREREQKRSEAVKEMMEPVLQG